MIYRVSGEAVIYIWSRTGKQEKSVLTAAAFAVKNCVELILDINVPMRRRALPRQGCNTVCL